MIREMVTATRVAFEQRMSVADMDSILDMMASGGAPSHTGKQVNSKTAMGIPAVWACVQLLADDFASMPLQTWAWDQPGISRRQAREHYLWNLFMEEANPRMSAFEFKQVMETWRNTHGNCFAEIETNGRGQVIALWPWRPDRVKITLETPGDVRTRIFYTYFPMDSSVKPITKSSDDILHVRNISLDGITGLTPIEVHRNTLGLMMAQTESAGRFYGNGMQVKGALEHPGKLGPVAHKNLQTSMEEQHKGLHNAYRLLILEEGMKYKEVGIKMQDAQFIESMGYNGQDVCRIYKVPAHKAGYMDAATNNNIEQLSIDYLQTTQMGINANWAGRAHCSLLSTRDRARIFMEPDFTKMMVADHAARATYYNALKWSLSNDEIRLREGYNPLPDGLGKLPRVPLNTAPMDSEIAKTGKQAAAGGSSDPTDERVKPAENN